jgi:hypothetical protein
MLFPRATKSLFPMGRREFNQRKELPSSLIKKGLEKLNSQPFFVITFRSQIKECKIILNIYVLRAFQWYKER